MKNVSARSRIFNPAERALIFHVIVVNLARAEETTILRPRCDLSSGKIFGNHVFCD